MSETIIARKDPAAWLSARGEDAATFLQGQFTNDLRRSAPGAGCTYGLWLNQKGRVLADSFVVDRGPAGFAAVSLASPAPTIRERLEAYIIADDVTVEDGTVGSAGWIVAGRGAAMLMDRLGLSAPAVGGLAEGGGAMAFRARAAAGPNWYVVVEAAWIAEWVERFAALVRTGVAREVTFADLARGRIEAGLVEIPTELGPGDLPNEGGLEHEAISFTKGCYLGQEVMARLHNLGQVRRRLFIVERIDGAVATGPKAGLDLFVGDKRVGELRRMVEDERGAIGLAMLHTTFVKPADLLASAPQAAPAWRAARVADGRAW